MKINGAAGSRFTAFVLTVMLLMTTCFIPARAAGLWDALTLNVLWTDGEGNVQSVPAMPVESSADRAFWARLPYEAMNQVLTVEALVADPDYSLRLVDEYGQDMSSFQWTDDKDALGLGYEYAYTLPFTVNGAQADMPIFLYVSSAAMPEEKPFEPFAVPVQVYYVTEDGTVLDVQAVDCWAGETTPVWAASNAVRDYELVSADTVAVTVDQSGSAAPQEVYFTYRQLATPTPEPTEVPTPTPVAEVTVPVAYYHVNGETIDFQEIRLAPGTHTVHADSRKTAEYEPAGETAVEVTVYPDGSVWPESVVFYYQDAAPAEAVIAVYYYHADGRMLDMQEVTLPEGNHVIRPNSSRVEGLELTGSDAAEVTVYADGSASAASVRFTYQEPYVAPAEAKVPVNYIHVSGQVLDSRTVTLPEGTHTVEADSSAVAGLNPVGSTSAEVTVYADGAFHPGTVDFFYEDAYVAPVTGKLTVIYQLADGAVITRDTMDLNPGGHTISADASKAGGYRLAGEQSQYVEVDQNGRVSPEVISFELTQPAVSISVYYQDDRGRDVAPKQTLSFEEDGDYVVKAEPQGLSADYELAPGLHTEVAITVRNGRVSQNEVYFYYQQRQKEPARANVTIGYFDTYGEEIARAQSVQLERGTHQIRPDFTHVPSGYELASAETFITVEVYENGTFSPQEVAFYFRKAEQQSPKASVTVYYRDDRGNDVALPQVLELADGTHVIQAAPEDLKPGYAIFAGTDSAIEVKVRGGVASKSQVVFYYQKTAAEPTIFTLPVNYYDTEGKQIAAAQYVKIGPGTYAIQASPSDLPEGYQLMMEEVLSVTVRQDGTTDPEEIAFYYKAPERMVKVTVTYQDRSGRVIAGPFTRELPAGYQTIQAEAARVPNGYDPQSADSVQVYVSKEGWAEPEQVILRFDRIVQETPIPVGQNVYRYAAVDGNDVAFRSEPSTARKDTVIRRIKNGSKVYVLKEIRNSRNEVWAEVIVNGDYGYMMSSFLDIMTQAESDRYAAGSSPAPTFTPVPTPTEAPTPTATPTYEPTQAPVEIITPPPTATPTLEPLPVQPPTEAPTPTATPYSGYALTVRATALRTGISSSDMTIMQNLAANVLVNVVNQVQDPVSGEAWSIVSTLNNQAGFVQDSALRYISDREAEPYINLWIEQNKTAAPTNTASPTPEPMQVEGYGVVLGDEVPFRQMASEYSRIIDNMAAGTIVYITGQTTGDGQYWHSVNYEGYWGYIRADLVRMLTIAEEEEYLDRMNNTPTPEPVTTNRPFDEAGMSSYGYVDGSSVNWRETPSKNGKKVGELKRYALCLVRGTEYVNGVTWYLVSYNDKVGYIHGDFFQQMTISELNSFLGGEEYLQGIKNNAPSDDTAMDDVGFTGPGGIVSAEDQWVNKNPDVYASYEPFNPIATVAPIQNTPTLEPLPGWLNPPATEIPTATPTFAPLPDVTYPTVNDGEGGSTFVWLAVGGLLLLAVGGSFALVRYQQNRRRIAMRAAQRRAQAARAAQTQRPHAQAPQQRTGTYPNQQTIRRPAQDAQYQPYSGQNYGAYGRPAQDSEQADAPQPRVGRRTAYRQAQQNRQDAQDDFDA